MRAPFVFRRAVRFDEIDAAGFVYFPRLAALAHEAMERIFEAAGDGGYARWVNGVDGPRIGFPCVHLACDFRAPLRFGDELVVAATVGNIGTTSVQFTVVVSRGDGVDCATIDYVVACARLEGPRKEPLPDTLRAMLSRHQVA
ncbi:MAG: acyl-CoA thioesterase [Polyangiales bacterium]